ncbi:MAG: hypothetical protein KC777_30010 [Cyanobacteria bacterium HKST-UBA02]|nr:hypothetical protein [Cyanobacteria bacterium HKST-UBA02]
MANIRYEKLIIVLFSGVYARNTAYQILVNSPNMKLLSTARNSGFNTSLGNVARNLMAISLGSKVPSAALLCDAGDPDGVESVLRFLESSKMRFEQGKIVISADERSVNIEQIFQQFKNELSINNRNSACGIVDDFQVFYFILEDVLDEMDDDLYHVSRLCDFMGIGFSAELVADTLPK